MNTLHPGHPPMTADDVRARFEAWAKGNKLDLMTNWREDDLALVSVGTLMKLAAHADLSGEVRELVEALRLAVRQNEHDMLMTGDELRTCTTALAKFTREKP